MELDQGIYGLSGDTTLVVFVAGHSYVPTFPPSCTPAILDQPKARGRDSVTNNKNSVVKSSSRTVWLVVNSWRYRGNILNIKQVHLYPISFDHDIFLRGSLAISVLTNIIGLHCYRSGLLCCFLSFYSIYHFFKRGSEPFQGL